MENALTFQSLIDVVLIVVDPVDVIQIHLASLWDSVLRDVYWWVSVLVFDEFEESPESKRTDPQPVGPWLDPSAVRYYSSAPEHTGRQVLKLNQSHLFYSDPQHFFEKNTLMQNVQA